MARLIKKDRGNYTNTSNLIIRDDRLHWNSRGIFVYLWSQANEWQFYVKEVVKHSPGGETELRTALKELEKYGYLKRTPRHGQSGSFNGMDWILSDVGGLNRHTGNPDDGSINENQQKESCYPSSAKPVERETRRTDNRTLRNNNNKNYQKEEITNTSNKSSSSSSSNSVGDPFKPTAETKEEEDQQISELIEWWIERTGVILTNPQYNQINRELRSMSLANATDLMHQVVDATTSGIRDPVAYLIKSLMNAN